MRKRDVSADELSDLNRIVSLFLDFAELRARQRQNLRMIDWRTYVDGFMAFNEQPLLQGNGGISREAMSTLVHERYEQFDANRRHQEAVEADAADLRELEELDRKLVGRTGRSV